MKVTQRENVEERTERGDPSQPYARPVRMWLATLMVFFARRLVSHSLDTWTFSVDAVCLDRLAFVWLQTGAWGARLEQVRKRKKTSQQTVLPNRITTKPLNINSGTQHKRLQNAQKQ